MHPCIKLEAAPDGTIIRHKHCRHCFSQNTAMCYDIAEGCVSQSRPSSSGCQGSCVEGLPVMECNSPTPNEEGRHFLSLSMVGRIGGNVKVQPVEARSCTPVPEQWRIHVVHRRQQSDAGTPGQLCQQLLSLRALQACMQDSTLYSV